MKRFIMEKLLEWNNDVQRKPLLLMGARQVGKTFILQQFANENFNQIHYINFDNDQLSTIFEKGPYDTEEIIFQIELTLKKKIDLEKDIIFFDEIQKQPKAIESLKYFCENLPQLAICCAGSHIGIEGSKCSFPVGKVNYLHLYPMSFGEFIDALEPIAYEGLLRSFEKKAISDTLHEKLWELQKLYVLVGGMPEAVRDFLTHDGDKFSKLQKSRQRHKELIKGYKIDFAKYNSNTQAQRINSVFDNIPIQIEKLHDASLSRYRFNGVLSGESKYTQLRTPIDWLIHSGLARKIYVANKAEHPPKAFTKENIFKLMGLDVGLMCTQLDIDWKPVIQQTIGLFKGFLAEIFTAQELIASGFTDELISWQEGTSEIEFLLNYQGHVIPVEVKSGILTQAKSLRVFKQKYNPLHAIKLSARNLRYEGKGHINSPVYLAGYLHKLL